MFSSTEMLEHWRDKVLPKLKEKDYRDDAERMAYNAYLEGCFFGGKEAIWHEDADDDVLRRLMTRRLSHSLLRRTTAIGD